MSELGSQAKQWVFDVLKVAFTSSKHIHSNQDEVYKIETSLGSYYLKISNSLATEHDNLKKLDTKLNVPTVIDFYNASENDYLLISELPGKNLVELIKEMPAPDVVEKFANAVRKLHDFDVTKIFLEANSHDVLLHGDMAMPNIIVSEQGDVGYIDLGNMAFGSPDLDLADAIWSLQRNLGPGYGEAFLKMYGSVIRTPK